MEPKGDNAVLEAMKDLFQIYFNRYPTKEGSSRLIVKTVVLRKMKIKKIIGGYL